MNIKSEVGYTRSIAECKKIDLKKNYLNWKYLNVTDNSQDQKGLIEYQIREIEKLSLKNTISKF